MRANNQHLPVAVETFHNADIGTALQRLVGVGVENLALDGLRQVPDWGADKIAVAFGFQFDEILFNVR